MSRQSIVTTYDPVLTIGAVSQTVVVEANTNTINTDNGQLSSTVGVWLHVGGPIWKNKLYGFGALQLARFYGHSQPGAVELPDAAG
jgi:hypothetical protein